MKKLVLAALTVCAALVVSCDCNKKAAVADSGLVRADFQAQLDGKPIDMYILKNANGMEVCLSNYGARILSVWVPGRDGAMRDVIVGYDDIQSYIDAGSNMGASVGRVANRIGFGRVEIDGVEHNFPINNGPHTLHGGPDGFHTKVWDAEQKDNREISFSLVSPDGDAGFPGEFRVTVAYTLTDDNALEIKYLGTTDRTTIVNMTNHAYFNLDGDFAKTCLDHVVWIDADNYTPVDSTMLTTGEIAPVEGTPMDFRTPTAIGARIGEAFPALLYGGGYDANYVLNHPGDVSLMQASMESPATGIVLEVFTDEPGVQFYTANHMNGSAIGKGGLPMIRNNGACLETQKFPDAANKPGWPSVVLTPDEEFRSTCIYKFSVRE